jgi:hypothetical protein
MQRQAVWGWWCVALVAGLVACGSDEIRQASQQSQCGGFTQALSAEPAADEAPVAYCDASVLYWRYSAAAHRLHLLLTHAWVVAGHRHETSLPAWTLDLAQGEGQIILDSRPMPGCRPS